MMKTMMKTPRKAIVVVVFDFDDAFYYYVPSPSTMESRKLIHRQRRLFDFDHSSIANLVSS
jgi:hypothetical protein